MWAFLHFVCASLFFFYISDGFGKRLRHCSRADGHSRKEVFLTFGVFAWEERAEFFLVGLFLKFPVTDSLALVVL